MLIACAIALIAADVDRITLALDGRDPDLSSQYPAVSDDGSVIAFQSAASNLIDDDTNETFDIFVYEAGGITRVSVSSSGLQANAASRKPTISGDGRYIVFESDASNLIDNDDNFLTDIFMHDRITGQTTRVNLSSAGQPTAIGHAELGVISRDGSTVVFRCADPELTPFDANGIGWDVYARDLASGQTSLVSVTPQGFSGDGESNFPAVSADGRFVTFQSGATNLVNGDDNNITDVFIRDRLLGLTEIVSLSTTGEQGNWVSALSSVSDDGRFVAFDSQSTNFADDDANNFGIDAFLRDRLLETTTLISTTPQGATGNGWSQRATVSHNGAFVIFESDADDLVDADVNDVRDVFIYRDGAVTLLSASDAPADGISLMPALAPGGVLAFASQASNLVPPDANDHFDIFTLELCAADVNGDGMLDILDFLAFQQRWHNADPDADCNNDGAFNVLDFVCFQLVFRDGCE